MNNKPFSEDELIEYKYLKRFVFIFQTLLDGFSLIMNISSVNAIHMLLDCSKHAIHSRDIEKIRELIELFEELESQLDIKIGASKYEPRKDQENQGNGEKGNTVRKRSRQKYTGKRSKEKSRPKIGIFEPRGRRNR